MKCWVSTLEVSKAQIKVQILVQIKVIWILCNSERE